MNTTKLDQILALGLEGILNSDTLKKELSEVSFELENFNCGDEEWDMPGYKCGRDIVAGKDVLWCAAGGDSQKPLAFVLFVDDEGVVHAYIPREGNCYDKVNNKAWNQGDNSAPYGFDMDKMRTGLLAFFDEFQAPKTPVFTGVELGFKKVHPNAVLPKKAHDSDAGMDVYAVENTTLLPFTPTLVKTGLVPKIPDGYEIQVRPRSGLALKEGITVWNSPGTIDAGYKSEIGVILLWVPSHDFYQKAISGNWHKVVYKGDRIAQFVVAPVVKSRAIEVSDVGESDRSKQGHNGFGSTGK